MRNVAMHDEIETLRNGTKVRVRSVRPDDKSRLSEAFRNLEPESIYSRFFYEKTTLTDADLKWATEVDFENTVALVVTVGEGEGETIIGGGRYVRLDGTAEQGTAEVAFAVEEDFRRQGIAGMLLRHLADIAREKGLRRFSAEVLARNSGMLTVFSKNRSRVWIRSY
jgi:GNAT superfamily N-acetyltransferase